MEQQQSINVVEDIMDMASRRKACWRESDCNSCLKSKHNCGWCPSVSRLLVFDKFSVLASTDYEYIEILINQVS